MDKHLTSYFIGIAIVFLSHLMILFKSGNTMSMKAHSYANLIAAMMIAYYFSFSEKYIDF